MNEISLAYLAINAGLVPIIVQVVNGLKGLGLPDNKAGLAALVTGIVLSFVTVWVNAAAALDPRTLVVAGIVGLLTGFAASGQYSQVKATVKEEVKADLEAGEDI